MVAEEKCYIENSIVPNNFESTVEFVTTTLGSVPIAGGLISATANHYIQKRQSKRQVDFFVNITTELDKVKSKINNDFIKSEDFEDLVEDTFYKVTETTRQKKLDALRAIFLNTIISETPNIDESFEILNLIYNWQERHIILLKILANPIEANEQMNNIVSERGSVTTSFHSILKQLLPNWSSGQIERTWQDLYDKKIHRTGGGINTMITDKGIHQLENILTEYGKTVVKYIENPVI